ncbi:MAG: hypothetical protein OKBPIBMD_00906 [Chlorobi bacterium]|nr:hypothetical protein [Chlorobiota bacterium]
MKSTTNILNTCLAKGVNVKFVRNSSRADMGEFPMKLIELKKQQKLKA